MDGVLSIPTVSLSSLSKCVGTGVDIYPIKGVEKIVGEKGERGCLVLIFTLDGALCATYQPTDLTLPWPNLIKGLGMHYLYYIY